MTCRPVSLTVPGRPWEGKAQAIHTFHTYNEPVPQGPELPVSDRYAVVITPRAKPAKAKADLESCILVWTM